MSQQIRETVETEQSKKKKKSKAALWIILVAVLAAAAAAFFLLKGDKGGKQPEEGENQMEYLSAVVEKRDIISTQTQSGVLEPADSYTMNSLVSGEILFCEINTGDVVQQDDLLYTIDASDLTTSLQRSENSLAKAKERYQELVDSRAELTVEAPIGGTVLNFNAKVGESVNKNSPVATIEDTSKLILTEYYADEYAGSITVGMPATVSVSDQMLTLSGTVKEVSSLKRISPTGISCFAVTVQVENPGSLTIGSMATCWLGTQGSEIYPSITDADGMEAWDRKTVYAGISGEVTEVLVRSGEILGAGQLMMQLVSETLDDEIEAAKESVGDAELSLQSQRDKLENYTLTAPIDGTIVEKFYKQGENVEMGKALCAIYDLSSLIMTLDVDELDIKSIQVGQKAEISSEANPGVTYEGVITEVGISGTSSNDVTTYPVKVSIEETEGLLPGMNVDVSIVTQDQRGVLTLPTAAIQTGGRVLVKSEDGSTDERAPEGYKYVEVTIGAADERNVQIVEGLAEGDEVFYPRDTARRGQMGGNMGGGNRGGNMGGMSIPGMPNMGGGNRGGNMGGGNRGGNYGGGNRGGNR